VDGRKLLQSEPGGAFYSWQMNRNKLWFEFLSG